MRTGTPAGPVAGGGDADLRLRFARIARHNDKKPALFNHDIYLISLKYHANDHRSRNQKPAPAKSGPKTFPRAAAAFGEAARNPAQGAYCINRRGVKLVERPVASRSQVTP
jgi:hypothetical protein